MKNYVIIKRVSRTSALAELATSQRGGSLPLRRLNDNYDCYGVVNNGEVFETLAEANKALEEIAFEDADLDCNVRPNFYSWALFCASIPNRAHTRTNRTRWYSDGDCTTWFVEPIELDEDGEPLWEEFVL